MLRLKPPRRRHSRRRVVTTVSMAFAWFCVPLMPGCDHRARAPTSTPAPLNPVPSPEEPTVPTKASSAPPAAGRTIRFEGLDQEYRGTTRVLPNDQVTHQKDSHD
jgi:hypothetical protein